MPERVGTVAQIWRYPVKSMGGELLQEADLSDRGIAGDRALAVRDIASGKVISAKTEARLMLATARTSTTGGVLVTLPGHDELPVGDPNLTRRLSHWLDRDVDLVAPSSGQRAVFEKNTPDEQGRAVEIATRPGVFFDTKSALHVLTAASLRTANKYYPEGNWDVRRFRPNVLVDTCQDGTDERSWIGTTLRLGGATAWVRKGTPRCVMTTREQPGLPRDRGIHRNLIHHHANTLGVLANPAGRGYLQPGYPIWAL